MWHMALKLDFNFLAGAVDDAAVAVVVLELCARLPTQGLFAGDCANSFNNSPNATFNKAGGSMQPTDNWFFCNCLVRAASTQSRAAWLSTSEARLYIPVVSSRSTACLRKLMCSVVPRGRRSELLPDEVS